MLEAWDGCVYPALRDVNQPLRCGCRLRRAEAAAQQAGTQASSGGEVAPTAVPGTDAGAPATVATGAATAAPTAPAAAAAAEALGAAAGGSAQNEEAAVLRHALEEQQQRVVEAVRQHGWHQVCCPAPPPPAACKCVDRPVHVPKRAVIPCCPCCAATTCCGNGSRGRPSPLPSLAIYAVLCCPCCRLQAWLLSEWKQEGTLALSTLVCRLLAAVSAAGEGGLLRYVPEMYLEATLDMVSRI